MPDVSPTKWHRAHVTWFFETFVLAEHEPAFAPFQDPYWFLFNSYYEAVGPRYARAERGVISRPGAHDVGVYRGNVDARMRDLVTTLDDGTLDKLGRTIELGFHHEQQHQELLLMDIKHVLSLNPLQPSYAGTPLTPRPRPAGLGGLRRRPGRDRPPRETASASTTSCPGTSSGWSPSGWPTGWSPTASGWSSWPTAATSAPSSGSPTAGRGCRPRAGRRRSTGPRSTASGSSTRCTAPSRSTPGCRSATSATTRPTPTPRGPASGCPTEAEWEHAVAARQADPSSTGGNLADTETATRAPPGPAPAACASSRRLLGVDLVRLPALPGLPPAGRRDRRVQRQVHVQPDGAARRLRPHPARATPGQLPQLLPAGARWALTGVRLADGGARADDVARAVVTVALDPRLGQRRSSTTSAGVWARTRGRCPPSILRRRGSALFDEITRLPEYYPTRASARSCSTTPPRSSPRCEARRRRARHRHEREDPAAPRRLHGDRRSAFVPVDVSEGTLRGAARAAGALPRRSGRGGGRRLHAPPAICRGAGGGWWRSSAARSATSTSRSARLPRCAARRLEPGDWLLLGTDLVKNTDRLIAAYDDAAGVTAEFVRTVRVLNRELGADFDLDAFSYVPFWDPGADGHAAARRCRSGHLPGADLVLELAAGEEIRMEISTKFRRERRGTS